MDRERQSYSDILQPEVWERLQVDLGNILSSHFCFPGGLSATSVREAPRGGQDHHKPPVELRECCYSSHVQQEDARKNKEQNTQNAKPNQDNERTACFRVSCS